MAELSAFFPPNQITYGYSEPAQVFIDRPVVAEVNIELISDDPSVVQVPPVATIPAGLLSTSVDVATTALPIPFPPKFVSIRATYAGKTLNTSVEVVPPAVARVALSPDTVISGSSSSGTVILNRPSRLGAVVVDVSSSAPGIARVSPTQVIIPQGSQSATFVITARDSAVPFGTAHAEINIRDILTPDVYSHYEHTLQEAYDALTTVEDALTRIGMKLEYEHHRLGGALDELKPLLIQPHSASDRIMEAFEQRLP